MVFYRNACEYFDLFDKIVYILAKMINLIFFNHELAAKRFLTTINIIMVLLL